MHAGTYLSHEPKVKTQLPFDTLHKTDLDRYYLTEIPKTVSKTEQGIGCQSDQ